jgi:transposase
MRCLELVKVTEILRLSEMNEIRLTLRQIGESVGCSKSTVGEIKTRCKECGLTYEDARQMTTEQINALIYPESFGRKPVKEEPDWKIVHENLSNNKRQNLQYIWEDYRTNHSDGLSYSRFCFHYNKWKDSTGKNVVFPQEREPGKELFIDWMGDRLDCVVDSSTGEIHAAHFFITTVGDSSYPFVEAFPDETQMNWLQGHIDAFKWYGAIPRVLVPDNCKTAVNKAKYYDPTINTGYLELSRHYDVAIIPARVRRPRDKASVESGVGWLETWLLEWLKQKTYYSFEALNYDIKERLKELCKRPFQKRPGSRMCLAR